MTATRGRPASPGHGGYLTEILDDPAALPDLDGALCAGHAGGLPAECWDVDALPADRRLAIATCARCPCLAACATLRSLPRSQRPSGVVAGVLLGYVPSWREHGGEDAVSVTARPATAAASASGASVTEIRPAALLVRVVIYDGSLVRMLDNGGELQPVIRRSHKDRRAAARLALAKDWARSDNTVAAEIGSGWRLVSQVRAELAAAGEIPEWSPGAPGAYPWKGAAARAELLHDWRRSNMIVGRAAGCSHRIVAKIRLDLELSGVIPRWRGPGSPAGYRRAV